MTQLTIGIPFVVLALFLVAQEHIANALGFACLWVVFEQCRAPHLVVGNFVLDRNGCAVRVVAQVPPLRLLAVAGAERNNLPFVECHFLLRGVVMLPHIPSVVGEFAVVVGIQHTPRTDPPAQVVVHQVAHGLLTAFAVLHIIHHNAVAVLGLVGKHIGVGFGREQLSVFCVGFAVLLAPLLTYLTGRRTRHRVFLGLVADFQCLVCQRLVFGQAHFAKPIPPRHCQLRHWWVFIDKLFERRCFSLADVLVLCQQIVDCRFVALGYTETNVVVAVGVVAFALVQTALAQYLLRLLNRETRVVVGFVGYTCRGKAFV